MYMCHDKPTPCEWHFINVKGFQTKSELGQKGENGHKMQAPISYRANCKHEEHGAESDFKNVTVGASGWLSGLVG